MKITPLRIFTVSSLVSAGILVGSLLFLNQPQCTTASASSGDCITGANIGLGLLILLSIGTWVLGVMAALARYAWITFNNKAMRKRIALRNVMSVTALSAITTTLAVSVIIYIVQNYLIR